MNEELWSIRYDTLMTNFCRLIGECKALNAKLDFVEGKCDIAFHAVNNLSKSKKKKGVK